MGCRYGFGPSENDPFEDEEIEERRRSGFASPMEAGDPLAGCSFDELMGRNIAAINTLLSCICDVVWKGTIQNQKT